MIAEMKAWLLRQPGEINHTDASLDMQMVAVPEPKEKEVLLKISCCGVCHTELDEIEGRTLPQNLPVIPGHQIAGMVVEKGSNVVSLEVGERVGVGWIYSACGKCDLCLAGLENLCAEFKATGRDVNGGYAQYMVVPEDFCYPLSDGLSDMMAAPLFCAGAIGYRSLQLASLGNNKVLGLTGFGSSGHLMLKTARALYPGLTIYVFARNAREQEFARLLGADWAGPVTSRSPGLCDAIVDTTPVWRTLVDSMLLLKPAGRLIINAIRKEESDKAALVGISYERHLWKEKEIKSVANITRRDVREFLTLAERHKICPHVEPYPFGLANQALRDIKFKPVTGAKVLDIACLSN